MTSSVRGLASLVLLALSAVSCGNNVPNIVGTWSGGASDTRLGFATLVLKLSQQGQSVSGTWTLSGFSNSDFDELGSVSGTVTGDSSNGLTVNLAPSDVNRCTLVLTTDIEAGTTLRGNYVGTQCTTEGSRVGSVILQIQP